MKNRFTNQLGFSHHLLLPIAAVVVVGAIGTYVIAKSSAAVADKAMYYSCSVTSSPKTVKKNGVYTVKVTYKNKSNYSGGVFTASNTNPLMTVLYGSKNKGEETPTSPTSYAVNPGKSFAVTFQRGTADMTKGKTYKLKFVIWKALDGNSTKLMQGTSCSTKIKVV